MRKGGRRKRGRERERRKREMEGEGRVRQRERGRDFESNFLVHCETELDHRETGVMVKSDLV